MKRLFATPSAKASIAKMEWVNLFAKNVQEEKCKRAEQGPVVRTKRKRRGFTSPFSFGASLGTSTRRLADVGHIPLAESCRGAPVYGKRQRPVVRICFSMPDKNNTNHGLTTYF